MDDRDVSPRFSKYDAHPKLPVTVGNTGMIVIHLAIISGRPMLGYFMRGLISVTGIGQR